MRVDLVENDELLVIMSGKQPMIKLLPRAAISSTESGEDTEMIKIPETKGGCECLSVSMSYLSVCLSYLSVCLSHCLFVCHMHICLSVIYLCVCQLYAYLSVISVCLIVLSVTCYCFSYSNFCVPRCTYVSHWND